ncbi:MAG TPA: hypothetical protein VIV61_08035 [Candidatus Ozemobacteraceae bacterium]
MRFSKPCAALTCISIENRHPARSTARISTIVNLSSLSAFRFRWAEQVERLDAPIALEVHQCIDQPGKNLLVARLAEHELEHEIIPEWVDLSRLFSCLGHVASCDADSL